MCGNKQSPPKCYLSGAPYHLPLAQTPGQAEGWASVRQREGPQCAQLEGVGDGGCASHVMRGASLAFPGWSGAGEHTSEGSWWSLTRAHPHWGGYCRRRGWSPLGSLLQTLWVLFA